MLALLVVVHFHHARAWKFEVDMEFQVEGA